MVRDVPLDATGNPRAGHADERGLNDPIAVEDIQEIVSALKKVDEIERSPATFTFSAEALRNKLNLMLGRINEQQDFLSRYLATNSTERNSLFYK